MNQSRTDTLEVPGATLHYEVRGAGPVLLLIPGGPADAGAFAPITGELSDRYRVVTYDPRGLSRSPFDGESEDTTVGTFADDAHRLLAALGTEPAYVLGSSGGALVGLELVSRHQDQVRAMVASGATAVASGRPRCPLCDFPMDPEGHHCPRWN